MVQIDDEASSMVRSSLNGLDWLPDADGGIGVGDADSEGSWVAADSGDWWLEDQRRQRLHPGDIYSPGNAIKASDCLAISAFLWCISDTAFTSPTVSPDICIFEEVMARERVRNELTPANSKAATCSQNRCLSPAFHFVAY
uniref:Uncharacterized protein n=1 Tax=Oryza glumipatula TaxID=40148 RepID=A0A0D9YV92_9ORYZ